jgi:RimJ/RimL family protein N-acetyltransferase
VPEDAEVVFRYRSDPDVMRYIPSGPDKSIEETQKILDRFIQHHEKYGFSKWAAELRETGELIGDSGLLLLEEGPDFELGYKLAREYWGKGFATECARGWLEAAFSALGLARVVAFADPDNVASIRVIVKLGMQFERLARFYGMDSVLYSISRESYVRWNESR